MNRRITALFAASEALVIAAIGIAIPLIVLTVLWGAQFGFAIDWVAFWRASVDIWLIGHGVDVTIVPDAALNLGVKGARAPVTVTIAALGFALTTLLLAVRAGRRIAETRYNRLGHVVSITVFAAASFAVTFSAEHPAAHPSLWQGTLLPTLVFAMGVTAGISRESPDSMLPFAATWSTTTRVAVGAALRGGVASVALLLGAAAVLATGVILASYARIITLYESLHTEVVGGVAVTLGQLAFIPNFVVWTASWLVGPGFSLGTGSTVSPLGTELGPVPGIPILGALPVGSLPLGFLGLVVPVVCGFLVGAVLAPGLKGKFGMLQLIVTGAGIGLIGGVLLGMLAWASSGAAGPGRLQHVGSDPLSVACWAAIELAASASIGLIAATRRASESPVAPR
jgi:hypothetical protein